MQRKICLVRATVISKLKTIQTTKDTERQVLLMLSLYYKSLFDLLTHHFIFIRLNKFNGTVRSETNIGSGWDVEILIVLLRLMSCRGINVRTGENFCWEIGSLFLCMMVSVALLSNETAIV